MPALKQQCLFGPLDERTATRKAVPENLFIKPAVISFYNKFMNGVDVNNQYRSYYPVGAQFKKWWKYLAWFFVNISIVHSFILSSGPTSHKKDVPVGRNVKGHSLAKSSERKRACVMCAKAGRKLWSGRTL